MALTRPKSMEELGKVLGRFKLTDEQKDQTGFASRQSDVFISTFVKSGTTWMQQVVHQLRCHKDEDFDDINEVVPWLERASQMGIDPQASQKGDFRAFKTHLSAKDLPETGRFINILRDPIPVILSWHRFFDGWMFESGSISLDTFARAIYFNNFERHRAHLADGIERAGRSDTLVLTYEDMKENPRAVPSTVAGFLELPIDGDKLEDVCRMSSREYMYQERSKFDENLLRRKLDKKIGLPPDGESSKVHRSSVHASLDHSIVEELRNLWSESIGKTFGFNDYEHLRRALPNPLCATRT